MELLAIYANGTDTLVSGTQFRVLLHPSWQLIAKSADVKTPIGALGSTYIAFSFNPPRWTWIKGASWWVGGCILPLTHVYSLHASIPALKALYEIQPAASHCRCWYIWTDNMLQLVTCSEQVFLLYLILTWRTDTIPAWSTHCCRYRVDE